MGALSWEHQGRWGDEGMPRVDNISTSFFGWRDSGRIDLQEAIGYLERITFGWLDWEFQLETLPGRGNTIPLPYVDMYVSVDGENYTHPEWHGGRGVWIIPGLSNESILHVKPYLRSDFIDILPWEMTKLIKITICMTNQPPDMWGVKGKPDTVWQIVQKLNN